MGDAFCDQIRGDMFTGPGYELIMVRALDEITRRNSIGQLRAHSLIITLSEEHSF